MTTKIIEPITPNTQDTTAPLGLGWWEVLKQLRRCESDEAALARTASEEMYMDADLATFRRDGLPGYVVRWEPEQ